MEHEVYRDFGGAGPRRELLWGKFCFFVRNSLELFFGRL